MSTLAIRITQKARPIRFQRFVHAGLLYEFLVVVDVMILLDFRVCVSPSPAS